MGSGTMTGALGDFWASIINPNLGGGNHAPHKVEEQVIKWIVNMIQFPKSASGLLVSGGSMANFTGLLVARNVLAGYNVRSEGLKDNIANRMMVYTSTEVHSSNQKALEIMGLGANSLCKIPVHDDYTIDLACLKKQIKQDKKEGLLPFCIIGNAGTINTGAIDDLDALADICESEKLWFHVDGAIGAVAILSGKVKSKLSGMERADSVALDLHKSTRGVASGENWFSEYGLQLSRRFRALKVWMSIKEHGTKRFGDMISKNIEQAQYLGELIRSNQTLELVAPIGLDIVCFRYNPGDLNHELLNDLNKEIKLRLEEEAIAVPGYTTLGDLYCIRIAIANHRTTLHDLDQLVLHVLRIGNELTSLPSQTVS
jgi:glutamate/tyrosine decarboxylase-like PLP-dependent enzyme